MNIIGIDIGTTNTKIILYRVAKNKFTEVKGIHFPTNKIVNGLETDFDIYKLWNNIKNGIKYVCDDNELGHDPVFISIASVGESGVIINQHDRVVGPCIAWFDRRGHEYIKELTNQIPDDRIYQLTGLSPHSNYSLSKIEWICNKYNIKNRENIRWLNLANYIAYKLTGVKTSEYSLASRTLAFDIRKKKWSNEILNFFNIPTSIFPKMVKSGDIIGKVTNNIAAELNISSDSMVSVAGHDHMVGSLIANLKEGEFLNSTGTTEGILHINNVPNFTKESFINKLSNGIYIENDYYSYFGSIPSAGLSADWLRRILNISQSTFYGKIMNHLKEMYFSGYFDKQTLLFIPHLKGSGPPIRLSSSKSLFYGFDAHTNKYDIIFSVFVGMCLELKNLMELFLKLTNKSLLVVKVIGSATKNDFWLQLKSDILGCQIIAYDVKQSVAMGAALKVALSNDLINNKDVVDPGNIKIFRPNQKKVFYFQKVYNEIYTPFLDFKNNFERGIK